MDRFIDIEAFYRIFRDLSTSVHSCSDVQEVLDLVVRKAAEVVNARGTVLRILSPDARRLSLSASHGLSEKYLAKGVVSSAKIITDICRQNKVILIDDVSTDDRVQYPAEARAEGIVSMLDLPLTLNDHVVGLIRIFFNERRKFSQEHLDFLVAIAEQCVLAIDKARLIEHQRAAYQQLATQTEKLTALGRMAAGIAHEINNPLGGILLYGTNLIKKVPPEGPLHEGLEIIIDETVRCKHIIQGLLEFSRDKPPSKAMANLNDVIEKAVGILENEFRLKHIRLEKSLPRLPDTLLDANQLEQVFVNILINAIEAVDDKGAVTIRSMAVPAGNHLQVDISDDGCGISTRNLAKIFEPFFSTKPKGTGLGLAVSYGIVRNHQGDIRVTSTPGQGTRFSVDFPIVRRDKGDGKGNVFQCLQSTYW